MPRSRRLLTKTADHVFRDDLRPFEKTVNHGISGVLLNQDEFDALVSFTFNVGSGNFSKSSLRKEINRATYRSGPVSGREAAINEITASFQKWNKSGGKVLEGLTRRRKAEADQFLKQPAPTRRSPSTSVSAYRLPSPIVEHEPHRVWSQVLPVPTKTKITVPHTTARASLLLVPSTHLILMTATFVAIVPCHPS